MVQKFSLIFLAVFIPVFLFAQEYSEEVKLEAHKTYTLIMSPFCPGRNLQDCPSSAAKELKQSILDQIAAGVSPKKIIDDLVLKYGQEISAVPRNEGMGRLAWLLPVIFSFLGFILIVFWIRNRTPVIDNQNFEIDPEVQKRIDEELDK